MIAERAVISPLVARVPEFAAFYEAERPKITLPIRWVRNSEYEAHVHRSRGGPTIYLRRIPPRVEDAALVAEELAHLVLDTEGFPGTFPLDPRFKGLSTTINDMLLDPLIIERRARYGFDPWDFLVPITERTMKFLLEENSEETMKFLKEQAGIPDPPDPLYLHWVVNYPHHLLEWATAGRISGARDSPLQAWLEANLPTVAHEGRALLQLVERVGYDTPGKSEKAMIEIIESYRLTAVIGIARP